MEGPALDPPRWLMRDKLGLPEDPATEPVEWLVIFHPTAAAPWMNRFVPGRFKHVSALGYVAAAQCWVYCNFEVTGVRMEVCPGDRDKAWLGRRLAGCASLKMRRRHGVRGSVSAMTCVSAVKMLLGFRCSALRPDGLWRAMRAAGAEIVVDVEQQ